ncbi:hypothetical protein BH23GEM5_BH23GEM5_08800 [soil metagenome]
MVRRGSVALIARLLCVGLVASACTGDTIVVPQSDEPFLYLVLNERSLDRAATVDGRAGQYALLLTTGAATEAPRYRSAERFEMRRVSDGAPFAWRSNPTDNPEVGSYPGINLDRWNFYLPDAATAEGLGATSLRPGESYNLAITTRGVTIRGQVTIPDAFSASLVQQGERRLVVWPRVRGAAGYRIEFRAENRSEGDELSVRADTAYAIPAAVRGGGTVHIKALDPNLYRYITEGQTARAGIDGGYGVFGAVSVASIRL